MLLLVANNAVLRATLGHHLVRQFRVDLVEAACPNEAVAIALQRQPGVTLLDLNPADRAAIDTIAVIQAVQPAGRVIAMVDCLDPPYLEAVVKAGAWSYLPKDRLGDQLDPLLRRALALLVGEARQSAASGT
ncbi:MAG: response regulator [Candidatus Dormibacteraceae bacterium]